MLSYLKYFLYSMTSIIYPVFYDIYNMKLSVVIYPYPPSLPLADAAPIGSQSPGNSFILKLKYCSRLSRYISENGINKFEIAKRYLKLRSPLLSLACHINLFVNSEIDIFVVLRAKALLFQDVV